MIATGTKLARPAEIEFEFDDDHVLDSDGVRGCRSMVVVGTGVIGIEYASMFAALGTRVTVVQNRPQTLEFCDPEVVESLKFHLGDQFVTFRFGEEVAKVESPPRERLRSRQADRGRHGDVLRGPPGRHRRSRPGQAGLAADQRGRSTVDGQCRTAAPYFFAVVRSALQNR